MTPTELDIVVGNTSDVKDQIRRIRASLEATNEASTKGVRLVTQFLERILNGSASVEEIEHVYSTTKRFLEYTKENPAKRPSEVMSGELVAMMRVLEVIEPRLSIPLKRYMYYPPLKNVTGQSYRKEGEILTGEIRTGYGNSMYEFHFEYPIEGVGARKDTILVIEDGIQTPIFDYCRNNNIVVYCNRCGMDITYTASFSCPARGGIQDAGNN